MKQALEALEKSVATCFDQYAHEQVMSRPEHFINQTLTALRQAIEQAEKQEPVAYVTGTFAGRFVVKPLNPAMVLPVNMALYTTPQPQFGDTSAAYMVGVQDGKKQREWVGLTDEERNKLWRDVIKWGDPSHDDEDLMKALEAKLKEKNGCL